MAKDEWGNIARALEVVAQTGVGIGTAQAKLIEACASGQVRTRIAENAPIVGFSLRPGRQGAYTADGRPLRSGPTPALTWRNATIDGGDLIDTRSERWRYVEISIDDLRDYLGLKSTQKPPPRQRGSRGPAPGTVARYAKGDRKFFVEMRRLVAKQGLSPTAAALTLAPKLEGGGTEKSRAARLAKLYRDECEKTH